MIFIQRILVIYNPTAGRGRVLEHWPQVEEALHESGLKFDVAPTNAPLDAVRLAQEAPGKFDAVVGVGGDGTIHEIVNGLLRASNEEETIPLGVIPLGNGDDFAKMIPPKTSIGGKVFNWREVLPKITAGRTHSFDVGKIQGGPIRPELDDGAHYFMNGMDVGFGAQTTFNLRQIPRFLTGLSAYLTAVIKTLIDYKIPRLRLQLDDLPPFEQEATLTAIMNGRCFGSGFWVCPEAAADDGFFDVLVTKAVDRLNIMRLVPVLMKGEHLNEPVVKLYRAKKVFIETTEPEVVEVDGEIPYLEARRLEIELLPKRLKVFV
ncbi:MAG: diacylglycerol/lipid kinase family protein [Bacteroidota bacterium]